MCVNVHSLNGRRVINVSWLRHSHVAAAVALAAAATLARPATSRPRDRGRPVDVDVMRAIMPGSGGAESRCPGACIWGPHVGRRCSPTVSSRRSPQYRDMEQWGGLVILIVALVALGVGVIDIICSGVRGKKSDRN